MSTTTSRTAKEERMTNPTTATDRTTAFVQELTTQMQRLAHTLSQWVQAEARPLQEIEAQVLRVLHDLGNGLLSALLPLATPARPAPDVACPCGQSARYLRVRPATVTTVLGRVTLDRALYHCTTCGAHHAPLDQQLQIAAGGLSLGLQDLLALLGATQDSFAQATTVLERLCLVQGCPNSVRAATEDLGTVLAAHAQAVVTTAQTTHTAPPAVASAPPRGYLSMDGVVAHVHAAGWKELKVGCVYTTRTCVPRHQPDTRTIHADQASYVTALTDAATFGWQLWAEACRRGVTDQTEFVVIGDGAHWIWNLADAHFPQATQLVDWYHASQYVWRAATTIFGERSAERVPWAQQHLDWLWDGRVTDVLAALEPYRAKGEGVTEALRYFTTHQTRMDYPAYRARGLQVGSGTVESACKQLVSARLKLAGMIWAVAGAEAVAVVRAWLTSDRWDEAMGLRPPPRHTYRRPVPASAGTAAAA
jgi:hypothetical protein